MSLEEGRDATRNYASATCKMISIMFQPLHDQRSNAYSGKDRRRIPGLSKAQRRIKASSTPALLDRDVERWVVIFEIGFYNPFDILGELFPYWILSENLGSCRMIVSRIFILVLIVSTWSFRCSLSLASFSGLYVEDMFRIISSFF